MCAILIVIKNHPKSLYNDKNGPTKKYCIHGPLKKKRLQRISLNSAVSWERCRASDGLNIVENPTDNFFARPRYVISAHSKPPPPLLYRECHGGGGVSIILDGPSKTYYRRAPVEKMRVSVKLYNKKPLNWEAIPIYR